MLNSIKSKIERLTSLYALAVRRKNREDALRKSHDELEQRVESRTADLIEANRKLKQEIDMRKDTEKALRKSEEKFRRLFRNMPVPTFIWQKQDNECVLTDYNDAAVKVTDGNISNFMGAKVGDINSPKFPIMADMEACFQEKKTVQKRDYFESPAIGGRKFANTCHVFIPPDMVMLHTIDLTGHKQIEEELKHALSQLRGIFEAIPGRIKVVDREYNILNISHSSLSALGLPENEHFIGRKCYEVLKKRSSVCPKCIIPNIFRSGRMQTRLSTSEEEQITGKAWKDYGAPIRNDSNEVLGAVIIGVDTSDLKKMANNLSKSKRAAESDSQAKSEFLTNMSHELRTPLNGILGYTQILRRDTSLTEKQIESINIIHKSGEYLLMMINEILDLSKIEARKMELDARNFHLRSFLESIININRVRAYEKGIAFNYEATSNLPEGVHGDEKRLRQILLNMLGNAIKFTEKGGVTFRVRSHELQGAGSTESSTHSSRPTVRIRFEVKDTGIGIPRKKMNDIFLPFYRVNDRKAETQGTGLGLAISQKLICMMGSRLYLKSTYNQGSTFWFSIDLPEITWKTGKLKKKKNIIGYKGARRRILITDDVEENRLVLKDILLPLGFIIAEAADGREALNRISEFHPDLVLMNLVMPVLDGFETIERIRDISELSELIIMAVSASVTSQSKLMSSEVGCDDFVEKPVRADDLLQKLSEHLSLEWVYEDESNQQETTTPAESGPVVSPPKEELDRLFILAREGDVISIQKRAKELGNSGDELMPFGEKLCQLAKNFQIKKIKKFLKEHSELEIGD